MDGRNCLASERISCSVVTILQWISLFMIIICLSGIIAQVVAEYRYTDTATIFGVPGIVLGLIGFLYATWRIRKIGKGGGIYGLFCPQQSPDDRIGDCDCSVQATISIILLSVIGTAYLPIVFWWLLFVSSDIRRHKIG